jgi:transcriptional regulator with XRE-family HTH domain
VAARPSTDRPSRAFRASERYHSAVRSLGQRIRAVRLAQGLTLERAAEQMGLDLKHLQQIEAGGTNVTLATLLRIVDGLGSPLGPLFEAVDEGAYAAMGKTGGALTTRTPQDGDGTNLKVGVQPNPIPAEPAVDAPTLIRSAGRMIADLRKQRGLTQPDLASRVGVSVQYLQRVEQGRQNLTLSSLAKFASALAVGVDRLVGGDR